MKNIFRVVFVGILSFLTMGCYFLRQGTSLIGIYSSAKPFDEVIKGTDLSPDDRKLIAEAKESRTFAVETLGLKENKNYTTFIETPRPYLADVVSACASDSFDQFLWDYPLVGKMPYKGFFDRKDAEEEAMELKKKNLDVMIRGVSAFSTLGWFSDPLFSFMASNTEYDTANLIIHELTHATVFLSGQGDFNENLASFVGDRGALLFLEKKYGKESSEVQNALNQDQDRSTFRSDLHELYLKLDQVYSNPELTRDQKLVEKSSVISTFQKRFRENYSQKYKTQDYLGFSERPVNNAYLMTYRNYTSGQDDFQAFYQNWGTDLIKMIQEIKKIPQDEKNPLGWMKNHKPD